MTSEEWIQLSAIILPIILPPLISLCVVWYKHMLQQLPQQKRDLVEQIVGTVVYAIEQQFDNTLKNPEKKQEATDRIKKILASLHINVTDELIDAMIEAAVYALNQTKNAPAVVVEQRSPVASTKTP